MALNVGFLINDHSLGRGGERVCITVANALSATCNVHIISLYQGRSEPFFDVDAAVTTSVMLRERKKSLAARKFAEWKALRTFFAANRFDVVVGVASYPSILLGAFARSALRDSRLVAWEHSNYDALSPVWKLLRKRFYSRLDVLVCLTGEEQRSFSRHFGTGKLQIVTIANPLSFAAAMKSTLRHKLLISAGSLEPEKGFDLLIEAFGRVSVAAPEWRLAIFGEGSREHELRALLAKHGLNDAVTLHRPVKDLQQKLTEASVYVMPSRREGFAMVIVEAMECGLACVSFDCPTGPRNIITDGVNGVLVPPADPDALAEALIALIADPRRMRSLAQRAVTSASSYALPVITAEWLALFGRLI